MGELDRPCTVSLIPNAAKEPVVNQRKRGPYAKNGNVVSPWELVQRRLKRAAAPPKTKQPSGRLNVGDVVMVWQSGGSNSNNGRLGVIRRQSEAMGMGVLAWYVESLGPEFDRGGDPAQGKISSAVFRDQWLLPVSHEAVSALHR